MIKQLYFIDRTQLPELTTPEWLSFRSDPTRYLTEASEQHVNLIMKAMKIHDNYGRDRPLVELLSDTPEEVTITAEQRRMLDYHYHVHTRIVTPNTREINRRDIFWVISKDKGGNKVVNRSYSDTHTCKEVILLLNGTVINYGRRKL
jgi:hypothetical protein